MVRLHKDVKQQINSCKLYHFQFDTGMRQAIFTQDLINAHSFHSKDKIIVSTVLKARNFSNKRERLLMRLQYYWYVHIKPKSFLCLAFICALASIMILMIEIASFIVGEKFSDLLAVDIDNFAEAYTVSFLPLFYIALCTFFGLFSMKFSYFFALRWNHHTDPASLLFGATLLMRLAAPMVYNYLQLQGGTNTSFIHVMGAFRDTSFLGKAIAVYSFPILLTLMALLTVFGVY